MSCYMTSHFCNLILDSVPVAVVTMDTDFKITYFNNQAEDLTGFSTTEAMCNPCSEILNNKKCDSECLLQQIKEFGEATTGTEAELVNRYEEHIPVRINAAAIEDNDGKHIGYLEIIEDISREKALEREKDNFLFMLAHDMKSPLVSILGLIKRIREDHEDMSVKKIELFCKFIKDSGEQLEAQVMGFLEYSRQSTDSIKLELGYINLSELLNQIVQRHQHQAAKKKLTIRTKHDAIQKVKVDGNQMQRVFENLLTNAIKFILEKGEIVTTVQETNREVVIQVKDNGPGISADELPYIFDAFHQSKSSNTGHGLGLAAVKAIVQKHGGRVAVKSSLNNGSIFTVRLPKIQ